MDNELLRASIAELFGTFTLVFVGIAAVASGQGVVTAALAHGLILVAIVFIYGNISGAHVNPAVTAGVLVTGKITINRAVAYWIAQFIGAIIAAVLVNILIPDGAKLGQTIGSLTANHVWAAALFEVVMTFFLATAVIQAAVYGRAGNVAALAIGLTLAGSILAGGTYTGASLNPARTFGPELIAGDFSYFVPYMIGIFGGGIIAGLMSRFILTPEK